MTIPELITRARPYPVFTISECHHWFPDMSRAALTVALARAVRKGYLLHIKRGLFLLHEQPLPDRAIVAMKLDSRSTISMETILSEAGVIPEAVFAVTAVTPAGTAEYTTKPFGSFFFRHEKPSLDCGWRLERRGAYTVRIASPEKALLDLLWFHRFESSPRAYVEELRLTIPERFSWKQFRAYARIAAHPGCTRLARAVEEQHRL